MATDVMALPPGFVLDGQAPAAPVDPAALPPGFVPDGHPTSGPTDNFMTDWGRRIGSAATNVWSGIASAIPQTGVELDPHTLAMRRVPVQAPADRAQTMKDAAYGVTGGTEYIPETTAGRITQAGLEGAMMTPLGGGSAISNALAGAGSQGAVEFAPKSIPPMAAALLGGLAGGKAGNMAQRAAGPMLPGRMDPETLALARTADANGITVPLSKASNNPAIRYTDSMLRAMPFSGYGALDEANQAAFNRSAAKTFGEDAHKITPAVLDRAYGRIGGVMDAVGGRTTIKVDQPMLNDMADIWQKAEEAGLDAGQVASIRSHINKLQDIAAKNNGVVPGDVYQNLTKKGESLDILQGNRSTTAGQLGGGIRDMLDEALERSAAPEDVAALRQARTQYKALKTVEPLTMRADTAGGATPSTGDISPAALLGRVNQQYKGAARAELGEIPLKDLAQVGQRFLKEPSTSGTGERVNLAHVKDMLMATLMGGAGAEHLGATPLHMGATMAATLLAPRAIGSVLRSPSVVRNQINGPQFSAPSALMSALLQEQNAGQLAKPAN